MLRGPTRYLQPSRAARRDASRTRRWRPGGAPSGSRLKRRIVNEALAQRRRRYHAGPASAEQTIAIAREPSIGPVTESQRDYSHRPQPSPRRRQPRQQRDHACGGLEGSAGVAGEKGRGVVWVDAGAPAEILAQRRLDRNEAYEPLRVHERDQAHGRRTEMTDPVEHHDRVEAALMRWIAFSARPIQGASSRKFNLTCSLSQPSWRGASIMLASTATRSLSSA